MSNITFGAEHEWADIPLTLSLPEGYGRDKHDVTIVNSNGIANDPSGKYYGFGGEINTPPTDSIEGQVDCLIELRRLMPMAKVNYRSNLHIHIRLPGLRDDLKLLKKVQNYIHLAMPEAFPVIEPIARPTVFDYPKPWELEGALRRWRRRRVSHQTLLPAHRIHRQLSAKTVEEFFALEVPWDKKKRPQWQCQPRLCVNLRQLLDTDTVEFRHFPGTLALQEFAVCAEWCRKFLLAAVENAPIAPLLVWAKQHAFPTFPRYIHWMEVRYRATVHDGSLSKDKIVENIKAIEAGTFDGIGVVQL